MTNTRQPDGLPAQRPPGCVPEEGGGATPENAETLARDNVDVLPGFRLSVEEVFAKAATRRHVLSGFSARQGFA